MTTSSPSSFFPVIDKPEQKEMGTCTFASRLSSQVRLLLWKRSLESAKNKFDILKLLVPPLILFALIPLGYATLPQFADGAVEPFLVPLAYFVFVQRIVIQIMYEKNTKLYEYMKMMGMSETAYWISYFISESFTGIFLSFFCAVISSTYFGGANFGTVLGLLFVYCLSVVPFSFALCTLMDTPETAGQVSLLVQFGMYVTYIILFVTNTRGDMEYRDVQLACSFFPPLALQMGAGSFLKSYDGMPLSSICGMMVADIFIYAILSWYLSQVRDGRKPFYFFFLPSYYSSLSFFHIQSIRNDATQGNAGVGKDIGLQSNTVIEDEDEVLLGQATVVIRHLFKTFGTKRVVDDLSFSMFENQIFALLGHNGAGKTTTISILTGLLASDSPAVHDSFVSIYGQNILRSIEKIRSSMGICLQHDILFDQLSLYEHIIFFAQLKGLTYTEAVAEAEQLVSFFHLQNRLDNRGEELSGGQKRKLSVALAVCGGSKFIILDEPTAGMDPLARRELWGLLSSLRAGRTMLLTTHYMDEADVLGDRVGIMKGGKMVCVGSPYFLKRKFGKGYKLIVNMQNREGHEQEKVQSAVSSHIPSAAQGQVSEKGNTVTYLLPFNEVSRFSALFTTLESQGGKGFGLNIPTLEDVFVNTGGAGGDSYVIESYDGIRNKELEDGDAGERKAVQLHIPEVYAPTLLSQVLGVMYRKLHCALHDFNTIPLLTIPIVAIIGGGIFYKYKMLSTFTEVNALITNAIYTVGYIAIPGLLAGFVIRERGHKLTHILHIMGCSHKSYWLGTFLADFIILMVPAFLLFISWPILGLHNYYTGVNILANMIIVFVYTANLISFAYLCSFLFGSYKACISFMPILMLMLAITPNFVYSIYTQIADIFRPEGDGDPGSVLASVLTWFIMIISPQGGLFTGLMEVGENLHRLEIALWPPVYVSVFTMCIQCVIYTSIYYHLDVSTLPVLTPSFKNSNLRPEGDVENKADGTAEEGDLYLRLDEDVSMVKSLVLKGEKDQDALVVQHMRKVYQNTVESGSGAWKINRVVAVEDMSMSIPRGEVFGLLGANGAGKTSLINMITRSSVPDCGDARINGKSVLSAFDQASKFLSIVTQQNSLWDNMTVYCHVFVFAFIRGVPYKYLTNTVGGYNIVDNLLRLLQLYEHKHKLSKQLSGGQKRKLCTAIALIGEPAVILLDEPSAGISLWFYFSSFLS
ncbi:ATP-binding cassette domain-containing protein [archaeon]|nr:MAG: ATP-binding cassette domain-containing protein [archaeon]